MKRAQIIMPILVFLLIPSGQAKEISKFKKQITKVREKIKKNFFLYAGPSLAVTNLKTIDRSKNRPGLGLNSQVGYKSERFDFALTSFLFIHEFSDIHIEANSSDIRGRGKLRSFALATILKIKSPMFYKRPTTTSSKLYPWQGYFYAGPNFSLQTLLIRHPSIKGGNFTVGEKITYDSMGYVIGTGIMWPKLKQYVELTYSNLYGKNPTTVGGRANRVKIISEEKSDRKIHVQTFAVTLGWFIF